MANEKSDESYHFEFLPLEGAVDRNQGMIKGVSVITAGVEARGHKTKEGHSLHTDMTTLKQMQAVGNDKVQVPVKWNHRTGADAVNGYLCNFKIRGQKLIADWVLMQKHDRYEQAMEIAEKMPNGVGLSASFRGKSKVVGKKAYARCKEMPSVDLVATPAANPDGLFEEGDGVVPGSQVDTSMGVMSDNNTATPKVEKPVELGDVMEFLQGMGKRLDSMEEFQAEVTEAIEAEETEFSEEGTDQHQFEQEEVADPLAYFEARMDAVEQARLDEAAEVEFAEHTDKVEKLIAFNQQLAAENQAMAAALREFKDGEIAFTAGSTEGTVELSTPNKGDDSQKLTAFESRVKELQHGPDAKEHCDAITFAIDEDEARYEHHLQELGALG